MKASVGPPSPAGGEIEMAIDRIGSAGDGIASRPDGGPLHVARTLPGEIVLASAPSGKSSQADLLSIVRPSPQRVQPPCLHFSTCGGCALQHWEDGAYADWKRALIVAALRRAGFEHPEVGPLIRTPPLARRRIDLAVERIDGGVLLGLHRAHAREIVDLTMCTIMHPRLFALVAPLRQALSSLSALRRNGTVLVNLLASGPDLMLRTDGPLSPSDRAKLAALAAATGTMRIAWAQRQGPTETAAGLGAPHVLFAETRVEPPPGAFLQASAEGEAAIVAAVLAGLPHNLNGRSRAIELYAGCGTISFPLAQHLRVSAYEGDAGAVAAMRRAMTGTRVDATLRDLARQPLSAKELSGAAVIELDPPYTGAEQQMPAIAASGVARVIHVGCNPGALARDAAFLQRAGYRLAGCTPIDQFLWSAHVESVSVFVKG